VKSFGIVVIVLVLVGVPLGVFLVAREPAAAPAMADPDKTIDLRGAIGGIRPLETRTDAEALLGQGVVVSSTRHAPVGGRTAILTRVRYPLRRSRSSTRRHAAERRMPASGWTLMRRSFAAKAVRKALGLRPALRPTRLTVSLG
jgi:hypothetical protein